jgi:diguanylate cyclase (GGDEF)-like protein
MILGPILIICITLATANLMSTYKRIHHQKQESIWSFIQLDKEMGNTLFEAQQYVNGYLDEKPLRRSYEVLWSRFPVTMSSMQRDEIFSQIGGLTKLINNAFVHVKSAESLVLENNTINKVELNQWVNQLNGMAKEINQQLLQNIASSNSEYSHKTANKIIKAAVILLTLIGAFVLYLGFLLVTLSTERKRNLHMLAHDSLTGLYSRDNIMRQIGAYCEKRTPFILLSFDLNKFKAVNDTFGHHAGDKLLIHLADKFKQSLNKFGMVGRIGGDEFLWLAQSDDARIVTQQYALFLEELEDPCIINEKPIHLDISSGGGIAADSDFHITRLLERVDLAMYEAKSQQQKEIFWESRLHKNIFPTLNRRKSKSRRKLTTSS